MKLTCQSCGAINSLEGFLDPEAGTFLKALDKLPPEFHRTISGYLGLFRPQKRGLTFNRALTLLGEIKTLVAEGAIQVQGQVQRPCPPRIWAMAMQSMIEQEYRIKRPLKNHNYLKQVAWPLADEADKKREQHKRKQEGRKRPETSEDHMSPEEAKERLKDFNLNF